MKAEKTTREKILESARLLMGKSGYSGVSINDLAKNVGVTKASIYYFFDNKESIYLEVLKEIIKEIQVNYTIAPNEVASGKLLIEKIEKSIIHGIKHGVIIRIPDMEDFKKNKKELMEINEEAQKVQKLMKKFLDKCGIKNSKFGTQLIIDMSHAHIFRDLCKTNESTPKKLATDIVKVLTK
jgi:TetR/AcrR family transcriptional regulator